MSATTANDTTINNQDDTTVPPIYHNFKRFAIATFVIATIGVGVATASTYKDKSSDRLLRSLRALQGRGRPMA